jgi:cytochrome b561
LTIAFHWITALLVVGLWTIGQTGDWLPRGPGRSAYWSLHVVLGFLLVAVAVGRISWRATRGRRLPAADQGLLRVLSKAVHHGLYLILVVVLALGLANAFVRGYSLFGLFELPRIGDPTLRRPINHWHGLAANVLLCVAALHAAAALAHQFVWRDRLIQRMWP